MDIRLDDVSGPEIAALFQEHLRDMHRVSPPESVSNSRRMTKPNSHLDIPVAFS